jgi:hypothetical protein
LPRREAEQAARDLNQDGSDQNLVRLPVDEVRDRYQPSLPGDGATRHDDLFRAAALPPFRPAAFFWAVVPPCFELPPDPDFLPPWLEAPGEFAIRAARSFDMPLRFRASYCLLGAGMDVVGVAEPLGHWSPSLISSNYAHAIGGRQAERAKVIGSALGWGEVLT